MTRKFVKQRGKSDCGIAAVANVCGRTYKEVKEQFGHIDRGGMLAHELDFILGSFCEFRRIQVRKYWTLQDYLPKIPTGRYLIVLRMFLEGHCITVVDGEVFGTENLQLQVGEVFQYLREKN